MVSIKFILRESFNNIGTINRFYIYLIFRFQAVNTRSNIGRFVLFNLLQITLFLLLVSSTNLSAQSFQLASNNKTINGL